MTAVCVLMISLEGCTGITYYSQLMALKRFQANAQEIDEHLRIQAESFNRLIDDVKNSRLQKGVSKAEIIRRYGYPAFCKDTDAEADVKEVCLYHYPGKYFNTDKVYLYFDKHENLYSWEFVKERYEKV